MANELNIQLDPFIDTGLTLLGKVFSKSGTQQGSTVTLSENASALYSGDFDLSSVSDGAYSVRFETNTPDKLYGVGTLYVRNNTEVSQENFFNPSIDQVTTDTASRDASKADVSGIPNDVDTVLTASHGSGSWQPGGAAVLDANIVSVNGNNVTSEDDFKADTTSLATKANQQVISDKASDATIYGIPNFTPLPD